MAPVTVFETEMMTVWYYPEDMIIHHKFHEYRVGEPFRSGMNRASEALRDRGANKWLSDDRKNSALTPEDTEWAMNVWFPQAITNGFKHWAVVLPEKVIGQMNIKRLVAGFAKNGVNAKYFTDPDVAMQWLRTQ